MEYSSRFSPTERKEIEFILARLLPERVLIHISDFTMHKRSAVFGETKFTAKFRVNVNSVDDIDNFITEFGKKSGTTYNRTSKKNSSIILHSRKLIHAKFSHNRYSRK